ncbi:SDR family NAD(P)-dependent oxidoreductase [Amycolatopsis pithecellobii]|uniref:SDR family NAD(P)-dependent oxidoreductase n=1 Tax=Amycolatopsis pithecellobii TaxID=664692 RepID=A0A6N7Z047_9PSEU|nr:SDR family oxidoreductase [Amycolatopsis pithecellobii]MTD53121.1 SDR family NAD(P)-dependent oxidoreductase [Amycolatopsis pithecellobii]
MNRFDGVVGVVTGGASGIGREIAIGLSALGMRLALIDLDGAGLAETVSLTTGPERHRAFTVDVADAAAVDAVTARIVEDLGTPGMLVSSAGRLGPHRPAVWELTPQDWTDVFGANLYGSVNFTRALVPLMRAAARPAHIVTIASLAGLVAEDRLGAYVAAKRALISFTETLRLQLAADEAGIGVTLVCPGGVPTNLNAALRATARSSSSDWLTAAEVAKKVIDAVHRGDFYVFTHASSEERIRRYYESVLG